MKDNKTTDGTSILGKRCGKNRDSNKEAILSSNYSKVDTVANKRGEISKGTLSTNDNSGLSKKPYIPRGNLGGTQSANVSGVSEKPYEPRSNLRGAQSANVSGVSKQPYRPSDLVTKVPDGLPANFDQVSEQPEDMEVKGSRKCV
jgi:hypothetical protein